jgi:hypothetical protein
MKHSMHCIQHAACVQAVLLVITIIMASLGNRNFIHLS